MAISFVTKNRVYIIEEYTGTLNVNHIVYWASIDSNSIVGNFNIDTVNSTNLFSNTNIIKYTIASFQQPVILANKVYIFLIPQYEDKLDIFYATINNDGSIGQFELITKNTATTYGPMTFINNLFSNTGIDLGQNRVEGDYDKSDMFFTNTYTYVLNKSAHESGASSYSQSININFEKYEYQQDFNEFIEQGFNYNKVNKLPINAKSRILFILGTYVYFYTDRDIYRRKIGVDGDSSIIEYYSKIDTIFRIENSNSNLIRLELDNKIITKIVPVVTKDKIFIMYYEVVDDTNNVFEYSNKIYYIPIDENENIGQAIYTGVTLNYTKTPNYGDKTPIAFVTSNKINLIIDNVTYNSIYYNRAIISVDCNFGYNNYLPFYERVKYIDYNTYNFGKPWVDQYKTNTNTVNESLFNNLTVQTLSQQYKNLICAVSTNHRIHLFYNESDDNLSIATIRHTVDSNGIIIGSTKVIIESIRTLNIKNAFIYENKCYLIVSNLDKTNDFPNVKLDYLLYYCNIDEYGNLGEFNLTNTIVSNTNLDLLSISEESKMNFFLSNKYLYLFSLINNRLNIHSITLFTPIDIIIDYNPYIYTNVLDSDLLNVNLSNCAIVKTSSKVYVLGANYLGLDNYAFSLNLKSNYELDNNGDPYSYDITSNSFTLPFELKGKTDALVTNNYVYLFNCNTTNDIYRANILADGSLSSFTLISSSTDINNCQIVATSSRLYFFPSDNINNNVKWMDFNGVTNKYNLDIPITHVYSTDKFKLPDLNYNTPPGFKYYIKT